VPWITLDAHAKVNLGLAVLARRGDGYHEIDSVLQTISLADGVRLDGPRGTVSLTAEGADIPWDATNLAWRAAEAVIRATSCPAVGISLSKNIPVAAGLGGGSADAAAVLVGMNALWDLGLDEDELLALASSIGSDVPFLVFGGTARARGRGEVLERLRPVTGVWFVLATPQAHVSAADAYVSARIGLTESQNLTKVILSAIQSARTEDLARGLLNDLEAGVVRWCPEVAAAREALEAAGAVGVVMSGSGPTVFGLARSQEEARGIASRLAGRGFDIHVEEPVDTGSLITGGAGLGGRP
jgi:4-diphosphocytidyl-2-C-methyl-D-erythritol kinase